MSDHYRAEDWPSPQWQGAGTYGIRAHQADGPDIGLANDVFSEGNFDWRVARPLREAINNSANSAGGRKGPFSPDRVTLEYDPNRSRDDE